MHSQVFLALLDSKPNSKLHYFMNDPNKPNAESISSERITDLLERIKPSTGESYRLLGNMFIVAIYSYWESEYRNRIKRFLSLDESLSAPILGDVRHLRRSIVHHNGIVLGDFKGFEVLQWYKPGDRIFIDISKMSEILGHIKQYLKQLQESH